jgi:hypothetical protein
VGAALTQILRQPAASSEIATKLFGELPSLLERYLPKLLASRYPIWAKEELDGVFVARATRLNDAEIELLGTCILLSDQTLVPFIAAFRVGSNLVVEYEVSLGEAGGGRLGISGPPCHLTGATRLHHAVAQWVDLGRMRWVYNATSTQER